MSFPDGQSDEYRRATSLCQSAESRILICDQEHSLEQKRSFSQKRYALVQTDFGWKSTVKIPKDWTLSFRAIDLGRTHNHAVVAVEKRFSLFLFRLTGKPTPQQVTQIYPRNGGSRLILPAAEGIHVQTNPHTQQRILTPFIFFLEHNIDPIHYKKRIGLPLLPEPHGWNGLKKDFDKKIMPMPFLWRAPLSFLPNSPGFGLTIAATGRIWPRKADEQKNNRYFRNRHVFSWRVLIAVVLLRS